MTVQVCESGVVFGDFDEDNVFLIEQAVAQTTLCEAAIKSVEFILLQQSTHKQPVVNFVEAKSSIPREADDFFQEIRDNKMVHSLRTWFCTVLGRQKLLAAYLPKHQQTIDVLRWPLRLILVIPSAPDKMLPALTDKLRQTLRADIKSWAIDYSAVSVLNEERAIKHQLAKGRSTRTPTDAELTS